MKPKEEIKGGVRVVRSSPDREAIAEVLRTKYESGDVLALFMCLDLWQREGQPLATAPEWAIEAWAGIGADWYREHVEAVESDARDWAAKEAAKPEAERAVEPKGPRKNKRTVKSRTLEQVAGIKPGHKKPDAWRFGRDHAIEAYVDKLKADAEAGRRTKFAGVDILNKRGEMTEACQNTLAKAFGLGLGGTGDKTKTLQRARKRAREYEEALSRRRLRDK